MNYVVNTKICIERFEAYGFEEADNAGRQFQHHWIGRAIWS